MTEINVTSSEPGMFRVTVSESGTVTNHEVTVGADVERLGASPTNPASQRGNSALRRHYRDERGRSRKCRLCADLGGMKQSFSPFHGTIVTLGPCQLTGRCPTIVVPEQEVSMRNRWALMLAVCLVSSVAGCGDDGVSPSTTESATSTPDPVDATTCADLADRYVEITRIIIDRLGERTDAEMETPPEDLESAGNDWFRASSDLIPRIAELCREGEFDALLCDRRFVIEPAGEAGARFLSDNYPSCEDAPREATTLPSGG